MTLRVYLVCLSFTSLKTERILCVPYKNIMRGFTFLKTEHPANGASYDTRSLRRRIVRFRGNHHFQFVSLSARRQECPRNMKAGFPLEACGNDIPVLLIILAYHAFISILTTRYSLLCAA